MIHVDLHHCLISHQFPLMELAVAAETGIVDENVNLQTGILRGRKDLSSRVWLSQVGRNYQRLDLVAVLKFIFQTVQLARTSGNQHQISALCGMIPGKLGSYSAGGSGNQAVFAMAELRLYVLDAETVSPFLC